MINDEPKKETQKPPPATEEEIQPVEGPDRVKATRSKQSKEEKAKDSDS